MRQKQNFPSCNFHSTFLAFPFKTSCLLFRMKIFLDETTDDRVLVWVSSLKSTSQMEKNFTLNKSLRLWFLTQPALNVFNHPSLFLQFQSKLSTNFVYVCILFVFKPCLSFSSAICATSFKQGNKRWLTAKDSVNRKYKYGCYYKVA